MVRVEVANLNSDDTALLLVEGVDDWHSITHIVERLGSGTAVFGIGYCGNDGSVLEKLSSEWLEVREPNACLAR